MTRFSALRTALPAFALLSIPLSGRAAPTTRPAPDRRWSLVYLLPETGPAPAPQPVRRYSSVVRPPSAAAMDSPDVAVRPSSSVTQSEISAFVDPADPNVVFVAANATDWPVTQVYGTGVYWSLDGGATWNGNDFGPGGVGNSGDPAAAIRRSDGRWIVGYISTGFGQGVSYTTDQGATWSHVNIFPSGTLDKNHLMVDNVPSSPWYGNVYAAWSNLGGTTNLNDIELVRSTDGGASWSAAADISAAVASGSHDQGINLQTGPNGEVYAAWAIYDSWPSNETAIGFNKSTDGGASWTGEFRAITGILGHRNTPLPNTTGPRRNSFPSMAVDVSGGPNDGNVYIAWTNQGVPGVNVGDVDIYVARSVDGGATFQTPVRVNQDTGTNAQWFPWIACDAATGQLAVIFFDRRDDPADVQARPYVATSSDGGLTWQDFAVGDVAFTPAAIPGLAGGYMGDYLGMTVLSGHGYPAWADDRSGNYLCYVSPVLVADPTIPNPPTGVTAFSDYTTPTSAALDWTDATSYPDGTPLGNFSIDIARDGIFLVNVDQGIETYTDTGLTDGQSYLYSFRTRDDVTDSLSAPVEVQVFAGGSPVPAAPSILSCSADSVSATIGWRNPSTQSDGTTLDDFAGVRIYRNGMLVAELARAVADTGSTDSWTDNPTPGSIYSYAVSAIDSELPVQESPQAHAPDCYVGDVPSILVWQPAGVISSSGDSLAAALQALGESVVLTDSLFLLAPDLNVHEVVFACVGVSPNKHVIDATEGAALDSFVTDGGRLYLEGGDCFNFDPESAGGYDVRPIFGLVDGPDGTGDLFDVTGLNDLAGFQFLYAGANSSIDELQPVSSTTVFQNGTTADRVTVFKSGYGLGRSIAASFEFGGLLPNGGGTTASLLTAWLGFFRSNGDPVLSVSPDSVWSTVYQDSLDTRFFSVGNPGTPNGTLTYAVAESPDAGWLSVGPVGGSLGANGSDVITLDFDATGLLPGVFTTDLIVTSNDPANPADTVAVSLEVLGAPKLAFSPVPLDVRIPFDSSVTDSLVLTNAGQADLGYSLSLFGAGSADREEMNAGTNTYSSFAGHVGNIYQVDVGLSITLIDQHLDPAAPTPIEFFVYEGSAITGTFTKKFSTTVTSGPGESWYSSGPIDVILEPAKFYYIGCGWSGSVTIYRDDAQNMPQTVAFGSIVSSTSSSTYPPPAGFSIGTTSPIIWDQGIEFGFPVDVGFASATAGTLSAGQSAAVVMDFTAGNTAATYTAVLDITHDIPDSVVTSIAPIRISVIDAAAVGAPATTVALPSALTLWPARPNPARGETVIRYDLPRSVEVRLSVFDVTGRRVRDLRQGPEQAGFRSVIWDGRDGGGRRVASGVYFYSLQAGDRELHRKLVMLR